MKQNKVTGIIGTAVLHVVVLVLLLLLTLSRPEPQEEGGVPVMFGDTEQSQGESDPYTMTEVDIVSQPETAEPQPVQEEVKVEQPLITQADEPSIQVKKEEKKKKEEQKKQQKETTQTPKKETVPAKVVKEKTEAEKRAEAERAAAQAAANKIAGAFGKGSQMGSKGTSNTGTGIQGSPTGNSNTGNTTGEGGYGSVDLSGRELGPGGLPKPVYNVQDEGRVVVTIVVNPAGQVISTSINKRTNTVNPALRKAAEEAARKARFNAISGVNNQTGTITYYFKLK